jgi:adenylate cyclase
VAINTAQLVGVTGEFAGKSFPIGTTLLIGRLDSADLRVPNLEVSRRHCQIERVDGGFQIKDLGSRSGTRLNDGPIEAAPLHNGDLLAIGPHVFRFELIPEQVARGAESPMTMAIDDPSAQLMLKEISLNEFSLDKQLGTVTEQDQIDRLRHHLVTIKDFADAIQTTLDTSALIERTLDELFRVFTKMDAGVIFLREPGTGQLAPAAIRRRGTKESGPVGYSTTILKFVEEGQKAVLNLDVSQDERFQHAVSVKMGSMRTHMCVPLLVRGEVVGAVYLVAEGKEDMTTGFDAEDLALLSSLAGTVAVSVKNASLAREAQRNAQLSSSLQRYVSAEVTRRLIEQGVEGALGARTADGVAMFCDLVGFTTLSEQLTPDRMAKLLNRYFRRALEIVFKHNGSINKFGGDSFLAVWGAIDSAPTDLISAVRASLEIQNDTFRLSTELAAEGVGSIQLTIGLNRGRFFAGDIGSDDRMEFTVIGDAVNVAARIQALAHGSQVLTTLDSLGDARSQMSVVLYPDTPIRGRATGVTVASVRSVLISPPISPDSKAAGPMISDESTLSAVPRRPSGQRVLASIPLEIPVLGAHAVIMAAQLDTRVELELLCDRAADAGKNYQCVAATPEWDEPLPPFEASCVASLAEGPIHLIRLNLTKSFDGLLAMLKPGTAQTAARPLRKKS